jgi:HlyD family secretion protein
MKRTLTIIGVVAAIIALIVFNKMTSKKNVVNTFTEVKKGTFEVTVSNSGELMAEKSLDIKGPDIGQGSDQGGPQGGGGGRGGGGGGGGMQGGGSNMRASDLKVQDIVPEGTIVKQGDYVAQLDRTTYDNTLKDQYTSLQNLQSSLNMKILDTAVSLTNLRDDIKNQQIVVEEATINLEQSKFEPPATIREAQLTVDRTKRTLEQKKRSYSLSVAQNLSQITHQKQDLARLDQTISDLQEFLKKFTITAPSSGMVIYKKNRNGVKIVTGSSVNAFDLVVATLPDLSSMISKIYVNEIEISKVKLGQKVDITVDALPEKAYTGKVIYVANIGEVLPNSDAKMFEVQIRLDDTDSSLRPSMTTSNKVIIQTYDNVVYIPSESVEAGPDSIPFVFKKNRTKQIVVLGEANEKNVIVEQGLEPNTSIYLTPPANPEQFSLVGENLISITKERQKARRVENEKYTKRM